MANFCKYCGKPVDADAKFCQNCGAQLEAATHQNGYYQQPYAPNIIINNNVTANNGYMGKPKDKWIAVLLCFFLGCIGAHKFYEGKIGMGILYLCTVGLFGIGVLVDFIVLLCKPNPYYVR